MNDPNLVYLEILKSVKRNITGRGSMGLFEQEVKAFLDDFYNDVYEEGFSDGYDSAIGDEPDDMTDFGPPGGPEDPEY